MVAIAEIAGESCPAGTAVRGSLVIPGRASEVARARRFVVAALGDDHPCADISVLLASEIVTNAVRHTDSGRGGSVRVAVAAADGVVLVAVTDDGTAGSVPHVCRGPRAESGHGLLLVEAMASRWGARRDGPGTTVWCEVTFLPGALPRCPGAARTAALPRAGIASQDRLRWHMLG